MLNNIVLILSNDFLFSPIFGWIFGPLSIIYLLLPRETCYWLLHVDNKYAEWKNDFMSFRDQETNITYNESKAYKTSKISSAILLIYCVGLLLFHYF